MALVTTPAVVLHAFPYSETSKVLRLLTPSYGIQSVIAKGALRPRSRFGGVLEPFTEGVATLFLKEGRDLHTLSGFELMRSRQGLGRDLLRLGGASLLAELVLRGATTEPDPALFAQLRTALDRLERVPAAALQPAVLGETWRLVARMGFSPSLSHCVACGRSIAPEESATFDLGAGAVRCLLCAGLDGGFAMSAEGRAQLSGLLAGRPTELPRPASHWRFLARFLAEHFTEGAVPRSLAFLAATLEES